MARSQRRFRRCQRLTRTRNVTIVPAPPGPSTSGNNGYAARPSVGDTPHTCRQWAVRIDNQAPDVAVAPISVNLSAFGSPSRTDQAVHAADDTPSKGPAPTMREIPILWD